MATPTVDTVDFVKKIIIDKIIDDKLFSFRTQTEKQKIIKENLKKFYKHIENIKAPLNEIVKEYKTIENMSTENAIDLKGKIGKKRFFRSNKGLEKYKVKLKDAVKTFKSNWLDGKNNYLTKNSNITNDPKQYEESQLYYYTLQSNILGIEESILNYFKTQYKNIIDPEETIPSQYDAAINAAKAIHTYKSKQILKIPVEDNFDANKKKILDFCINVRPYLYSYSKIDDKSPSPSPSPSSTPTPSSTTPTPQLVDQLENRKIGSSYIKAIYKTKMDVVLNEIEAIENIEDKQKKPQTQKEAAEDLTKNYRKLLKYLFMIMENYYFQDLKYKHKWSYKTLNNTYKKNKVGTWKGFKRDFSRFGQTITPFGKYKSKVRLGRKYRINPLFGVEKSTSTGTGKKLFSYNIKDLTKHKDALVDQIKKYNDYIKKLGVVDNTTKSYVPKPKKHYEFYEVKKRLEKEIRKLKIIKFFLLRKTVRLKSRTFGKRPKLLNTINTLKAKIKERDKKFKKMPNFNITTAEKAKQFITQTGKSKTKKRLKKLSKMLKAQEVITAINATVNYYKSQNNTNSDRIKTAITDNKITAAKAKLEAKAAKKAAAPSPSPPTPPPGPPTPPPNEYTKLLAAANKAKAAVVKRVTEFDLTLVQPAVTLVALAAAILAKVNALPVIPLNTAAKEAAAQADNLAKSANTSAGNAKSLADKAVTAYATYIKSLTDLKVKTNANTQTSTERLTAETAVKAAEEAAKLASPKIAAAQTAVADAKKAEQDRLTAEQAAADEKAAAEKAAADAKIAADAKAAADAKIAAEALAAAEQAAAAAEALAAAEQAAAAETDRLALEQAEEALRAATAASQAAELAFNATTEAAAAKQKAEALAATATADTESATLAEAASAATKKEAAAEQVTAAKDKVTAAKALVEALTEVSQQTKKTEAQEQVDTAEKAIKEAEQILTPTAIVGGSRKTKKSNLRKTKKSKARKIKDKTTRKTKKTNKSKKTKKH
jgi:hypothetical protein